MSAVRLTEQLRSSSLPPGRLVDVNAVLGRLSAIMLVIRAAMAVGVVTTVVMIVGGGVGGGRGGGVRVSGRGGGFGDGCRGQSASVRGE